MIMIDGAVANWALFLQRYRQYSWSIFTDVEFVIATPSKGNMNRKWHLSVAAMVLIMKTEERRKKERSSQSVSFSPDYQCAGKVVKQPGRKKSSRL